MRIDSRDTRNTASDVSYSDECRTKTVLSVCEKNVSAFSCYSEVLQYQQIIHLFNCNLIENLKSAHTIRVEEIQSIHYYIIYNIISFTYPGTNFVL